MRNHAVRVDDQLWDAAAAVAASRGRPLAYYIRSALSELAERKGCFVCDADASREISAGVTGPTSMEEQVKRLVAHTHEDNALRLSGYACDQHSKPVVSALCDRFGAASSTPLTMPKHICPDGFHTGDSPGNEVHRRMGTDWMLTSYQCPTCDFETSGPAEADTPELAAALDEWLRGDPP